MSLLELLNLMWKISEMPLGFNSNVSVFEYFTDGRRVSFIFERKIAQKMGAKVPPIDQADYDLLDKNNKKWEVRSLTDRFYFASSKDIGSGREFKIENLKKKLSIIEGYLVCDAYLFPNVPSWKVVIEDKERFFKMLMIINKCKENRKWKEWEKCKESLREDLKELSIYEDTKSIPIQANSTISRMTFWNLILKGSSEDGKDKYCELSRNSLREYLQALIEGEYEERSTLFENCNCHELLKNLNLQLVSIQDNKCIKQHFQRIKKQWGADRKKIAFRESLR